MEQNYTDVRAIRSEIEICEMQFAHAYARRDELLNKRVAPRLENLRGRFVARVDRDIWEHENRLDTLRAQLSAAE